MFHAFQNLVLVDVFSEGCLFLLCQAEENIGMVMIFTIVSAVQEKLTDLVELIAEAKKEEEERKQQEVEEAEMVIIH